MTAWTIFSDSFRFYGRLFNKIFWLSVAYSLLPFVLGGVMVAAGQASGSVAIMLLGMLVMLLLVGFFYTYQITLIDQFSSQGNDSLRDALPRASNRTLPFLGSGLSLMMVAMLVMLLSGIVMAILMPVLGIDVSGLEAATTADAASLENRVELNVDGGVALEPNSLSWQDMLLALVMLAPLAWVMYRLIFVPLYVIVDGSSVRESFTLSNQHVRKNRLVFWGLSLMFVVMLFYTLVLTVSQLVLALNPLATAFLQFALNIVLTPFFAVYLYRLFMVSKPVAVQTDSQNPQPEHDDRHSAELPKQDDVNAPDQDDRRD